MLQLPDESWPGRVRAHRLLWAAGADPELPDLDLLHLLPEHLVERYEIVPLATTGDRLQLGMVDPLNQEARDDAHLILGLPIDPVLISRDFWQRCLDKLRGKSYCLPLVAFEAEARVFGPLAVWDLTLSFANPCREPVELSFGFPLPAHALLKRFEVETSARCLHATVRAGSEVTGREEGTRLALQSDGLLVAEGLEAEPGQPVQLRIAYLERLDEPLLRLPLLDLKGAPARVTIWLDEIPLRAASNQPCLQEGRRVRLLPAREERDFLLRWEMPARPRLFTEGGYFLASGVGPALEDRGLNYLPESLKRSDCAVVGRHLGSGGLQDVSPQGVHDVGLALLWAAQCRNPSVAMAVELGLITEQTVFVLVDDEGRGHPRLLRDEPVNRLVDTILMQAVLQGATSVHLRCQAGHFSVAFRSCGRLHEAMSPSVALFAPILSRLLTMAGRPAELGQATRGTLDLHIEGQELDGNLFFQPLPRPQMVLTLTPRALRKMLPLGSLDDTGLTLVAAPDFRMREQLMAELLVELKGVTVVRAPNAPSGVLTATPEDDLESLLERADADSLLLDATLTTELARSLLRLARTRRVVLFMRAGSALQAVEEMALLGDPWWTADVLQTVVVASREGIELRRADEAARDSLRSANWRFLLRGAGIL